MLRVGLISRTFFNAPLWCAERQGCFADAGLEVETEIADSGTKVTKGLRDGSLQFAVGPPDGVVQDVAAGGTLRILAGNTAKLSHYVIAQPRFKRMEDLKGAVIGCLSPKEGTTFVFQEMAARHGLHYPGDYVLDPVGGAPTRWKLLQAGRIDAGLQSVPLSSLAEDAGFSNLGATFDYIPDYQFTTVNADGDWARARRGEAVAFLGALLRGMRWLYDNREAVAAIAAEEMAIAKEYGARAWDEFTGRGIMPADLSIGERGLAKAVEIMQRAGVLPAGGAETGRYVDLSYLEAAKAEIR